MSVALKGPTVFIVPMFVFFSQGSSKLLSRKAIVVLCSTRYLEPPRWHVNPQVGMLTPKSHGDELIVI